MALVRAFSKKERDRSSLHEEIEATYSRFERDGRVLLQIDTYGRSSRQMPDKISQSIQLDRKGGEALYKILKDSFNLK